MSQSPTTEKDLWIEWIQSDHAHEAFEQYKQSRTQKQKTLVNVRSVPVHVPGKPVKPQAPNRK